MTVEKYLKLKNVLINQGYSSEIEWSENLKPCDDAQDFCLQYIWVVCNSGMKNQIAETIYAKILKAISDHVDISTTFGHKGKVSAIKAMIKNHKIRFREYLQATDKLKFCLSLPWIGNITKYHLVKNLGLEFIKPDRHLVRISKQHGTTPHNLCKKLADSTGDRITTVDIVLWRAANLKLI